MYYVLKQRKKKSVYIYIYIYSFYIDMPEKCQNCLKIVVLNVCDSLKTQSILKTEIFFIHQLTWEVQD